MSVNQTAPWALLKPLAYSSTAFVGFNMAATSIIFIPALLRPSNIQQDQSNTAGIFAKANELSMKYNIPLEVLSMVSYGALAHKAYYRDGSDAWKGWIAAVGIIGTIFPLKNILMAPAAKTVANGNVHEKEFEDSLRNWSTLNLIRSGIVLGAGIVAAMFDEA